MRPPGGPQIYVDGEAVVPRWFFGNLPKGKLKQVILAVLIPDDTN